MLTTSPPTRAARLASLALAALCAAAAAFLVWAVTLLDPTAPDAARFAAVGLLLSHAAAGAVCAVVFARRV